MQSQLTDILLPPARVAEALARIEPYIHRTPLLMSQHLNAWLGHEFIFKADGFQKIGAFKIRGALNALLVLKEQGRLPQHVVAFSSGNHAQAVALAGSLLGIRTTVIMPSFVSQVKQQATRAYGAELILTNTRPEAEALAMQIQREGAYFLHPSDDDDVIAGQGTACLEAIEDGGMVDAIFAACGGGGWLAGTWLAAQGWSPAAQVVGAEPAMANDAARSLKAGHIVGFDDTPMSIADGARTLRVTPRTFAYLQQLSGMVEVTERDIAYWTQWLQHLLKIAVEPTSALAMAAAHQWLRDKPKGQRVLTLLSGANVDAASQQKIWAENYLEVVPA
jgi:threo-3-hydroxy-L-aspartate ammonia-lyase